MPHPNYSFYKQNQIWCVNIGEYMFYRSSSWVLIITYSRYIICPPVVGVREYPNYSINKQNRIWCVNIGKYMVFGVYRGL